jgi:1,3-beta-glucan synthase
MSGYPQGGHYDNGYNHQGNTDSYYQDDQHGYYDQHEGYHDNPPNNGEGYYDES